MGLYEQVEEAVPGVLCLLNAPCSSFSIFCEPSLLISVKIEGSRQKVNMELQAASAQVRFSPMRQDERDTVKLENVSAARFRDS